MTDVALANEPLIRAACFVGVLMVMAAWEVAARRRRRDIPRAIRWTNNVGLVVIDAVLVRVSFPILAVGAGDRGRRARLGPVERFARSPRTWPS